MKRLLVVVDMQNDFITGALGSAEAQNIVPEVASLVRQSVTEGSELVFTLDTHGENYLSTQEGRLLPVAHCIKNTAGWELIAALAPFATEAKIFEKGTFGSVDLAEFVKRNGFEEVTLCGVCTDICVVSNALLIKAHCPEICVKVAASACAGTTKENHLAAIKTMQSCQIVVE